ncbi:minor capsid protein [Bacillus cereus]|uniref:minor capsid protein n=1 Tax=Bacillus cereus TaxID=1396 RepID=UPI0024065555|nr:minor capsid protein [Bacillus cereus]MDF9638791.1 minor capsid protein [Bacillus cereus]
MVSVIDLVNFLKANKVGGEIYPLAFPVNSPDACSTVLFVSGTPTRGGVGKVYVQIMTRDVHPAKAEKTANDFRSFLEKRTDFLLSDLQVIVIECQNFAPLYLGQDENNRHLFSLNYTFTMGV